MINCVILVLQFVRSKNVTPVVISQHYQNFHRKKINILKYDTNTMEDTYNIKNVKIFNNFE